MAFVHRDQLGVYVAGEKGREEERKKGEEKERLVSIYITNWSAQGLYFYS